MYSETVKELSGIIPDTKKPNNNIFLNHLREKYNDETIFAFKETEDIASGKIKPKTYDSFSEAMKDLEET